MIKTVSEIFHSAKDSISKKSESPLIGAFLTAWVIWNWQPIMYFFFLNQDISKKIEKVLSYKSWLDQFLFPLIIAIFYILVLPYIQILFTLLLKKSESFQNKTILEKKKQISDEEHNQKLDLINKKIELENKEKYLREQSAINTQINDLNEQIKSKEKERIQKKASKLLCIKDFIKKILYFPDVPIKEFDFKADWLVAAIDSDSNQVRFEGRGQNKDLVLTLKHDSFSELAMGELVQLPVELFIEPEDNSSSYQPKYECF